MMTATPQKKATKLWINANRTYGLQFNADYTALVFDLLDVSTSQKLWKNLTREMALTGIDTQGKPITIPAKVNEAKRTAELALDPRLDRSKPLQVTINGKPVAEFICEEASFKPTPMHGIYQLIVAETRGMSNTLNPPDLLPYDRAPRMGYEENAHAPITDLHTHVSTQISAKDLYELSLTLDKEAREGEVENYVTYPIELLAKLGVPAQPTQATHNIESYEFKPLKHEQLKCERGQTDGKNAEKNYYEAIRLRDLTAKQRDAVIKAMDAPQDGTKSFQQVEEDIYRHTTPLTRNPRLVKPMLRRIAENYAAQGIQHAELATSALLGPNWFEAMVDAVDELECGTKNPDGSRNPDAITVGPDKKPFTMRFLVGLPRNNGPKDTMLALERTKFIARHPYIVGVDLMGNETNKTSDFHWALSHMAMWARKSENTKFNPNDGWNFKEDFLIRVHAGESAKNPRNVADAIQIAHEHKVRVRVGHAQNAALLDGDNRKLYYMKNFAGQYDKAAKEQNPGDWFGFEKCPDSNQLYRMKALPHHVVIKPHSDMAATYFGQDGNGLSLTTPRQTALAALATGITLDELAAMRKQEEVYIANARARDDRKRGAFENMYKGGLKDLMAEYRAFDPKALIEKRFEGKTPFLIGGASDNSWKQLAKKPQQEINQMMELLVMTLNPKTVYFVLGRVESEGVNKALDRAIKNYNLAHPSNKFEVMGRFGHASGEAPTGELAETISGFESIPGGISVVPDSQIKYIRDRHGKVLLFDGAQFTASMLHDAQDERRGEVPFGVYVPPENAFMEQMMQVVDRVRRIKSPEDLVKRTLRDFGPDRLFETQEERDKLLSPGLAITDDHSCDVLLEQAEKQARQSHADRMAQAKGGRAQRIA